MSRFALLLAVLCLQSSAADQWPHPRQAHETAVPASFDCAMRKLAYQVSAFSFSSAGKLIRLDL